MKLFKKMMALVIAMVMMVAMAIPAMAATQTPATLSSEDNASITVTLPTVPTGSTANNTYKIYKVFGATVSGSNIAYVLSGSHEDVPAGFTLTRGYVTHEGDATELTAAEITAIKNYITEADLVATVTTTASDASFTVTGLDYGYYYIDTTTGTLVTVTSTNPNASVNDKNEVPPVDKKITGATGQIDEAGKKAIAQVGTDVEYTGTVTKKKGAENYTFKDKMDDGLTFNNDVKVYNSNPAGITDADALAAITVAASNYTVGGAGGTGDGAYTFDVAFNNTYMAGLNDDTVLYIVYSGKINNNALTIAAEKNTAWLEYGDENSPNSTPKVEVEVYSAKITVTKKDGSTSGSGLAGAGFVLKNSANKYYKKTTSTPDTIEWVDNIDSATEFTSDSTGALSGEFTGLIPGTYTLIEKTVPPSYNKCADVDFEIINSDYTAANLEQSTIVVNEQGNVLPSTGGIGTTMFYVIGAILVLGAGILLVTRRRMNAN